MFVWLNQWQAAQGGCRQLRSPGADARVTSCASFDLQSTVLFHIVQLCCRSASISNQACRSTNR
jgi:hypothetical protein